MGKPIETIRGANYTVGQAGPWSGMFGHTMGAFVAIGDWR